MNARGLQLSMLIKIDLITNIWGNLIKVLTDGHTWSQLLIILRAMIIAQN